MVGIPAFLEPRRESDPHGLPEYVMPRSYVDAVAAAGASTFLLPATTQPPGALHNFIEAVDGLLLAGGIDVDPAFYGETPLFEQGRYDLARDQVEAELLRMAVAARKPVLGICRGCQLINAAMGGSLYQDIHTQLPNSLPHAQTIHRAIPTHALQVHAGSLLYEALSTNSFVVNSLHHQAVQRLGTGLRAVAQAEDGVVEGIEAEGDVFVLAVQFHPEDLIGKVEPVDALFRYFVEACRAAHK